MNRGYLYTGAGLLALVAGFGSGQLWVTLACLWASFALLYFAAGYLFWSGDILRKRADGRMPFGVKAMLAPVLWGTRLYQWLRRKASSQNPAHRIADGLWVGGWVGSEDAKWLKDAGVGAILDVTAELVRDPECLHSVRITNPKILLVSGSDTIQLF